ncbi:MAG: TonB-dependent receptor [Luminiphilus sp.]|nr:TonB-dependent receptor [Luminiphilus sp.]
MCVKASPLEEVIVEATLLASDTQTISLTTLDEEAMDQRGTIHLEDALTLAANTNASAGASRQRFFQIRGIGERSQFIEPNNPSVVALLDGIDISGLGGALTSYDLDQINLLRGPQGSRMGAGALAGLINLTTQKPTEEVTFGASLGVESYGGSRASVVANSAIGRGLYVRLAHQQYQSDGWSKNTHLGREDTNARDEQTTRLGLKYQTGQQQFDIGLHQIDIDNGYDAFSLDNKRTTLSDEPGEDSLDLIAARLAWQYSGDRGDHALQISSVMADSIYSYDEDWSFAGIAPGWEYSSFDAYSRSVDRSSLEWRTSQSSDNRDWVAGIYLREDEEQLTRDYTYLSTPFHSRNKVETSAIFGQLRQSFAPSIDVSMGARLEQRQLEYGDSNNVRETLDKAYWTGDLGIQWRANANSNVFASISRGLRAGGVNASLSSSLTALESEIDTTPYQNARFFDAESLINLEVGWRFQNTDETLRSSLTAFSMSRDDQQVKGSLVIQREDGSFSFTDFTDNAASGSNRGLEWSLDWQANSAINVELMMASLNAVFDNYTNIDGSDLSSRDQPQAPTWQYSLAMNWQTTAELTTRIELTGRDDYFLSDRHAVRSPQVTLLNAYADWKKNDWTVALWARNLTDEETVTRGFGTFGNDPRKEYITEPYYQFGEPRVIGLTVNYRFER